MILVECVRDDWDHLCGNMNVTLPAKGSIHEVDGHLKKWGLDFIHLATYSGDVYFRENFFCRVEFPPSLTKEIEESLTRELILK